MFQEKEHSGIKYIQSSIFDEKKLVHAFSTRAGGNTPSPLHSFSMGTGGFEEFRAYIEENRKKLCETLNLNPEKLLVPDQKHTDNIAVIKTSNESVDLSFTDGIITNQPESVLMLLFADCVPIILHAPEYNVLGIIHAGWRGTAAGICTKAVKIFKEDFNVPPQAIFAAVGPAIGQCCYPVMEDAAEKLKSSITGQYDEIFEIESYNNKIKVDLKKLNTMQLSESGVVNIDTIGYCTSCKNSLFYSYRSDNGKTGRHCALASMLN